MRRTYSYLATQNMLKIVLMTMFLSPKTTNSSNYWQTNVHAVKAVKQHHHHAQAVDVLVLMLTWHVESNAIVDYVTTPTAENLKLWRNLNLADVVKIVKLLDNVFVFHHSVTVVNLATLALSHQYANVKNVTMKQVLKLTRIAHPKSDKQLNG
jgi:hypothetical protein